MTTQQQPDTIKNNFLLRMEQFIRRHTLLNTGNRLVLGVSGGIDSMVMLDALCEIRARWQLQLSVAHVNYRLRGKASDADERFVIRAAEKFQLPVYIRRADTASIAADRKESVQSVARELRYSFFSALAHDLCAEATAVAHNANDNAETILFNFCRGAGIRGLKGISINTSRGIIRPLQFATRAEIEIYAKARHIRHREDSSNATDAYTRNFLRHTIFPALEQRVNPSLVHTLNNESAIFATCSEYLDEAVKKLENVCFQNTDTGCTLMVKQFREQHIFMQQMLVKQCFMLLGIEPNFVHIEEVVRLSGMQAGKTVDCGNGYCAQRSASAIEIGKSVPLLPYMESAECGISVCTDEFTFLVQQHTRPKTLRHSPLCEFIDAATVTLPLTIRSWQPGDSFVPLGMTTRKKLSDFFTDQKISRSAKEKIPIVLSGNEIVWIAGLRLDDRYKISQQTTSIYKLSIKFHL